MEVPLIPVVAARWLQPNAWGMDPFEWACKAENVDSFLRFIRLKKLPRVPTFGASGELVNADGGAQGGADDGNIGPIWGGQKIHGLPAGFERTKV